VTREDRVLQLGHDGLLEPHDAWEDDLTRAQASDEVPAELRVDGSGAPARIEQGA
jgi:hypothetical protein